MTISTKLLEQQRALAEQELKAAKAELERYDRTVRALQMSGQPARVINSLMEEHGFTTVGDVMDHLCSLEPYACEALIRQTLEGAS